MEMQVKKIVYIMTPESIWKHMPYYKTFFCIISVLYQYHTSFGTPKYLLPSLFKRKLNDI